MIRKTEISKNIAEKKIIVKREFDGDIGLVWRAWTEPEILDQWWAPRPWKAETKFMDFKTGGYWLYSMVGPEGEKHWSRADFIAMEKEKFYEGLDYFSDENGVMNKELPVTKWLNCFSSTETGTLVEVNMTFESEEQLQKIVEMGFEQGFSMAHGNLDEWLASSKG